MHLKPFIAASAAASLIACGTHPSAESIAERAKNIGVYVQRGGTIVELPSYGAEKRNMMAETKSYNFDTAILTVRPDSFIVNLPGTVVTEAKLFLLADPSQASWHYFRADDPRNPKPIQAAIEPLTGAIFKITPTALPESATGFLCLFAQMPEGTPDRLYAVRLPSTSEASTAASSSRPAPVPASSALPSYISGMPASVLKSWLVQHPTWRVAESKDCACPQDLAAMSQSRANPEPYYAAGDFNRDGNSDFAVVFIDSTSKHKWGWTAGLAIFNGPLQNNMSPSFVQENIGKPTSALLFYRPPSSLLLGQWEGSASTLEAAGASYILKPGE